MSFRSFLYWLARLLGDIEAVLKGRADNRIAQGSRQAYRAGSNEAVQVELVIKDASIFPPIERHDWG